MAMNRPHVILYTSVHKHIAHLFIRRHRSGPRMTFPQGSTLNVSGQKGRVSCDHDLTTVSASDSPMYGWRWAVTNVGGLARKGSDYAIPVTSDNRGQG